MGDDGQHCFETTLPELAADDRIESSVSNNRHAIGPSRSRTYVAFFLLKGGETLKGKRECIYNQGNDDIKEDCYSFFLTCVMHSP